MFRSGCFLPPRFVSLDEDAGGLVTLARASCRCSSMKVPWDCSSALKVELVVVPITDGTPELLWSLSNRLDMLICSDKITLLKLSVMLV